MGNTNKATAKELKDKLYYNTITFSTEQKGRGRQGLYVEGYYLTDVYPNIEEHFNIIPEDDAFIDDETGIAKDCDGNEVNGTYKSLDKWLANYFKEEIEQIIKDLEEDERIEKLLN